MTGSAAQKIQRFYRTIPNVLHKCPINRLINNFFYHISLVSCIDNSECTLHEAHFWDVKGGFAVYCGKFVNIIVNDPHKSSSPAQAIDLCTKLSNLCMVIIYKPNAGSLA